VIGLSGPVVSLVGVKTLAVDQTPIAALVHGPRDADIAALNADRMLRVTGCADRAIIQGQNRLLVIGAAKAAEVVRVEVRCATGADDPGW